MDTRSLVPIIGTVQNITNMSDNCCNLMVSMRSADGPVNFIISDETLVIDSVRLRPGMRIAAFYNVNYPVPLIYPPQYRAQIITALNRNENIMLKHFNRNLLASDNSLQLNVDRMVNITTANGQDFLCSLGNQDLLVYYTVTTRSIPPQTTPRKIVVFC